MAAGWRLRACPCRRCTTAAPGSMLTYRQHFHMKTGSLHMTDQAKSYSFSRGAARFVQVVGWLSVPAGVLASTELGRGAPLAALVCCLVYAITNHVIMSAILASFDRLDAANMQRLHMEQLIYLTRLHVGGRDGIS